MDNSCLGSGADNGLDGAKGLNAPLSFGGEDNRYSDYQSSRVVILTVPYEGTVSYGGGTGNGPAAILNASSFLEIYDEELGADTCEIGIHTLPPVDCTGPEESVMASIRSAALSPLKEGKFLAAIGGEHSVTGPLVDALIAVRGKDFGVLQIDAHTDLRDEYEGSKLSHACIMRRIDDMSLPYSQVGIRALSREEAEFIKLKGMSPFFAHEILARPRKEWIDEVVRSLPEKVYLTIDLDGLDPSIMPSTGTPEPGGLGWYDVTALIRKVAKEREIIGIDMVELAPMVGMHAPDFLAAKLLYRSLGYIFKSQLDRSQIS
ncbi:MAG: agmatinase [bacterium]|nr:agmatinase [bacterium]